MKLLPFYITLFFLSCSFVSAFGAGVNIPEQYGLVHHGEPVYFEVSVKYPENTQRVDLNFEYEITQNGQTIITAKTIKAIENQMSYVDSVIIPEFAEEGLAVLSIRITDFDSLEEVISTSFYVSPPDSSHVTLYFFIIAGVSLLVGVLLGIDIVIHKRLLFRK